MQRGDKGKLEPVARLDHGQTIQPKLLLALLCFCYARQTYGSAEVRHWLRQEVSFRHFTQDELLDTPTLGRLRRKNRAARQGCLTAPWRFLVEQ